MNKNGEEKNQAVVFISLIADILGILSFVLAIIPIIAAANNKNVVTSIIAILSIDLAVLIFIKRHKIAKCILFFVLNLTAPPKSYKLIRKEVIYEFVNRTQMRHEKNFDVKVLHQSFSHIDDKYKWTGDTPLEPQPKDSQHFKVDLLGSKFGLDRYNVKLLGDKRYSKGDKLPIGVVIENINDPQQKSSLHLSSGIYEKTDCLIMKVRFDPTLNPINGRCLEYIHYNDDNHYWSQSIEPKLDGKKKCYEWIINKPFYGGKYLIEWEFE